MVISLGSNSTPITVQDLGVVELASSIASTSRQFDGVLQHYLKAVQDGRIDRNERRRLTLSVLALQHAAQDLRDQIEKADRAADALDC